MKQAIWVLAALALGILAGSWIRDADAPNLTAAANVATSLGTMWLDALMMTLAPLIFSLLVIAIVDMAERAAIGPVARRALILFTALLIAAGCYTIAATQGLLALWPVSPEDARALIAGAGATETTAAGMDFAAWLRSLVPSNVIAAAAQNATLPIVVFAGLFGVALTRLPAERRAPVVAFFRGAGEAMIVIIKWVLALAPLGVFGLSLALGLASGFETLGVIGRYILIVCLVLMVQIMIAIILGLIYSGLKAGEWLRALAPVQAIAASTQSSIASLPAMLTAAMGPMKLPQHISEFVLPLAVAVFRFTSPVANIAVALFVCHVHGVEPNALQFIAAILVAFAVSISSVGLPGQASFLASVTPICAALGAPVTILPLLLAVEMIPDVFRTIGNVTGDLAATAMMNRAEQRATVESEAS